MYQTTLDHSPAGICLWLLCGLYHPLFQFDQYIFDNLDKALDIYSTYEKVLRAGNFNAQEGEKCLDIFLCKRNYFSSQILKHKNNIKNPGMLLKKQ